MNRMKSRHDRKSFSFLGAVLESNAEKAIENFNFYLDFLWYKNKMFRAIFKYMQ